MPFHSLAIALALLMGACSSSPSPTPMSADRPSSSPTSPTQPADAEQKRPQPMTTPEPSVAIRAALDHPDRPAEDRARDADRRPAQVLEFFGVSPGMKVAELMTGRGYYAEILARVVGKTGVVYAHNSPFVVARFADQPLAERLARPGLEHVVRLDRELEQPGLPSNLDIVLIILFYHDTYWQNVDRTAMNRAVYAALAPGGIYGVIDHHAKPGSADRDVKTLHRVDADLVKREILAAGFEFIADSDVLHDPDDARTINVFDQSIRGRTDRFIFKFRKPAHAPPNHSP